MLKKCLFIIFTLLFALQSTSALMDQYQPHQSDEDPFAFDHGHDSDRNNQTQNKVVDEHISVNQIDGKLDGQLDNHHCCHCHGVSQFFASVINNIPSFINVKMLFEYDFNPKSFSPSANYRPPRV